MRLATFSRQIALVVLLLSSLVACSTPRPAVTQSQLAALRPVLADTQGVLNEVIGQLDNPGTVASLPIELGNQLRSFETRIRKVRSMIDALIEGGTASRFSEATSEAFEVLSGLHKLVEQSSASVLSPVNDSLAQSAVVLDAIPYPVDDTILAVVPYRVKPGTTETTVSVYGFFPSHSEASQPVNGSIGGVSTRGKRQPGRIAFEMPQADPQTSPESITISLQGNQRLEARVIALSREPFTLSIEPQRDNPNVFETIVGTKHFEDANSATPVRVVHLDAPTLLRESVSDVGRYDASSTKIVNVTVTDQGGGKPCEDCPEPFGRVIGWTADRVDIEMSAPICAVHPVMKSIFNTYVCGGGGSNYRLGFVPTLTVKRLGVPDLVPVDSYRLKMGWQQEKVQPLPSEWTSLSVHLQYNDGTESKSETIVLTRSNPSATTALYTATANSQQVTITTR